MTQIIDKDLREYLAAFFKPILDIKYVIGEDIGKTDVKDLSQIDCIEDLTQLESLARLYYLNEYATMQGQSPYLKIATDREGVTYATITREFIMLANIDGFSKKIKTHSISDKFRKTYLEETKNEALKITDDNSFEDTIDERFDHEMYKQVSNYCGVKELPYKKNALGKNYSMIFLPDNNTLVGKKIVANNKGMLYDNDTAEPIIKTKEFKLFSN